MRFMLLLLLIPLSACSNLLKSESLMQNGNVFYYENLETKANGYVKLEEAEGDITKYFENGFLSKVKKEDTTFTYQNSYLHGLVVKDKKEYYYDKGRFVESQKVDIINNYIKSFEIFEVPDDVFKVYKKGIISSEFFTINNKSYLSYFDENGIIQKTIVESDKKTKYYLYDQNGALKSYVTYVNGIKQGDFFEVEGSLYTFGTYNNNQILFTKSYNKNGDIIRAKEYKKNDLVTFYEYFSEDSIRLIGYLTYNLEKIGRWTYFYQSGNTKEYREFVNNSIAVFNKYYEDGVKKASGTLNVEKNHYVGILKTYYNNGEIQSIEEYDEEGKLQNGAQYFDEKGIKLVINNQ